jgi:hypothetical protein
MNKIDLKNKAWLMFVWYAILRGILLSLSNTASQEWLANPVGHGMAMLTVIYLLLFIFTNIEKYKIFFMISIGLTAFNLWCFSAMGVIFINDPSPINFSYVMMDLCILAFFNMMCIFCKHTIYNTNLELNNLIGVVK